MIIINGEIESLELVREGISETTDDKEFKGEQFVGEYESIIIKGRGLNISGESLKASK